MSIDITLRTCADLFGVLISETGFLMIYRLGLEMNNVGCIFASVCNESLIEDVVVNKRDNSIEM